MYWVFLVFQYCDTYLEVPLIIIKKLGFGPKSFTGVNVTVVEIGDNNKDNLDCYKIQEIL